jgi:hypothetical protein
MTTVCAKGAAVATLREHAQRKPMWSTYEE